MITVVRAGAEHVDCIYEIELDSFAIPWTRNSLYKDIVENKISIYLAAIEDDKVLGYAGMWHVVNEGHITNLAVRSEYRNRGIGDTLVKKLIEIAIEKEMLGLTLEVRYGNANAQKLYTKNGFKYEGIRKKYYTDTGEDALIMWKYF